MRCKGIRPDPLRASKRVWLRETTFSRGLSHILYIRPTVLAPGSPRATRKRSRPDQTLVNAEHYGRSGANPPSLTVRDHVYTCRLVPCFFPQLNCHHGHVTVPVDIGILLLYIYNYAHLVFNEIT